MVEDWELEGDEWNNSKENCNFILNDRNLSREEGNVVIHITNYDGISDLIILIIIQSFGMKLYVKEGGKILKKKKKILETNEEIKMKDNWVSREGFNEK